MCTDDREITSAAGSPRISSKTFDFEIVNCETIVLSQIYLELYIR